jgi:hypothetical protein
MGKSLNNVEGWKNLQFTSTAVGGMLAGLCYLLPWFGINVIIPEEALTNIAEGIAGILLVINLYLTPATTKKIGITPIKQNLDTGD